MRFRLVQTWGLIPILLFLALGACSSSYRDDEKSEYYRQVLDAILDGSADQYGPSKVVYLETPEQLPFSSWMDGLRKGDPEKPLERIFGPYLLDEGYTVACAWDKSEEMVFFSLVQDRHYELFLMRPLENPLSQKCKTLGAL